MIQIQHWIVISFALLVGISSTYSHGIHLGFPSEISKVVPSEIYLECTSETPLGIPQVISAISLAFLLENSVTFFVGHLSVNQGKFLHVLWKLLQYIFIIFCDWSGWQYFESFLGILANIFRKTFNKIFGKYFRSSIDNFNSNCFFLAISLTICSGILNPISFKKLHCPQKFFDEFIGITLVFIFYFSCVMHGNSYCIFKRIFKDFYTEIPKFISTSITLESTSALNFKTSLGTFFPGSYQIQHPRSSA